MRRAVFAFVLALSTALVAAPDLPAKTEPVNLVNGIGLIDYSRQPSFKIGDWVKYHVTGSSELGMTDDYTVTVIIGGEENFWGEDCFWVETRTQIQGQGETKIATMMSYAIFGDTATTTQLQKYQRKTVIDLDEEGNPSPVLVKPASGPRKRQPGYSHTLSIDTLGTDTIRVDKGSYVCRRVSWREGVAVSNDIGDSTMRTEFREERVIHVNDAIPITSVVREEILNTLHRTTWRIGHSQEAARRTMERSTGVAVVVDYGSGMETEMVPHGSRKPLAHRSKLGTPAAGSKLTRRKPG